MEHDETTNAASAARPFRRRIKQRAVIDADGRAVLARGQLGREPAVLDRRELDVLTLMADGRRRDEIAERLGLTTRSLRELRRGLLAKLGARTDQHATAIAFRRGLLRVDRRGGIGSSS